MINSIKIRKALHIGWYTISIALLLLLVLPPFIGQLHYFIDIFSHFQLQLLITTLTMVLIGRALHIRRKHLMVALLICVTNLVIFIHPSQFRSASANLKSSADLFYINANYYNEQVGSIVQVIKESDIETVVVVEANEILTERLTNLLGEPVAQDGVNSQTCLIYSKSSQVENSDIIDRFENLEYPLCAVKVDGINIIAIHPYPPLNSVFFEKQGRYFAQIDEILSQLEQSNKKYLLVGDFNSTYYSPLFRKYFGRRVRSQVYSWSVNTPLMLPIDHAISNIDIAFSRSIRLSSDHIGLFVDYKPN